MTKPTLQSSLLLLLIGAAACAEKSIPSAEPSPAPTATAAAASAAPVPVTIPAAATAPAAMALATEGAPAPDFGTAGHDGSTVQLSALRGKPVVLYFYPKDETPGCTIEAEAFRDAIDDFKHANALVIGVSMDSLDSHREFAKGHKLDFPLVSDADGKIAALYGVDTSRGFTARTTFVIGSDGKIARRWSPVKVDGHAAEVLAVVKGLK